MYSRMVQKDGGSVELEKFLPRRLAQLRMRAGVSARDMSLSMGQSQGYINKIESGQNLPSMTGFLYICEFLKITPKEFFDDSSDYPQQQNELQLKMKRLSPKQLDVIDALIDVMTGNN